MDKRLPGKPLSDGGGHEHGLRSGTENVPAIVGFGAASELAAKRVQSLAEHTSGLRDHLARGLVHFGAPIFGAAADRLPNTSYFAFEHIDGESLVIELNKAGFAVASGSACSSTSTEPSATLLAMSVEPELARGAVRLSLGWDNTEQQAQEFLTAISQTVDRLRRLTAVAV